MEADAAWAPTPAVHDDPAILCSAVREIGARLMDAVDPALVDQARTAVSSIAGISDVRELHVRWVGHTLHTEVDATVDPALCDPST